LKCPPDFICGHEFVGEIVEKGDDVKKFNIGDKVCELRRRGSVGGAVMRKIWLGEGDVERTMFILDRSADCRC
jgi:hypothetical protein